MKGFNILKFKKEAVLAGLTLAAGMIWFPEYVEGYEKLAPVSVLALVGFVFWKGYATVPIRKRKVVKRVPKAPPEIRLKKNIMQDWESASESFDDVDFHDNPPREPYKISDEDVMVRDMDEVLRQRQVRREKLKDEVKKSLKE